jgi:2-polyprenyl-6-methoxyphenol hydroxylase-like FAD-dependent oxidoreductase
MSVCRPFRLRYEPWAMINTKEIIKLNVFDVPFLPNYYKNNIILIGDSAHAVSQNSGQSASVALEDAMLLAKLIQDENSLGQAFETFERTRKPRVERIVAEGRKRGGDKVIVSAFQQKMRELMIRIFVSPCRKRKSLVVQP